MEIKDKETYFPRTFNEQMAWIGEEVEHIVKHNATRQTKQSIRQQGREAYGQNEKIMVHIFDEATGKWSHDVDPELMFKRNVPADTDKHKEIECLIDAPYMFLWILENVRKGLSGYFYDHSPDNGRRNEAKTIQIGTQPG